MTKILSAHLFNKYSKMGLVQKMKKSVGTIAIAAVLISGHNAKATTFTSKPGSSLAWGAATTWNRTNITGPNTTPAAGDDVKIAIGSDVLISTTIYCQSVELQTGDGNGSLTIQQNGTLITTGAVVVNSAYASNNGAAGRSNTVMLIIEGELTSQSSLTIGSIATGGNYTRKALMEISQGGILNLSGDISFVLGDAQYKPSLDIIGQINLKGNLNNLSNASIFLDAQSTVNFNSQSGSQQIPVLDYSNLKIEGGYKTLTASIKVAKNLDLTNGGLSVGSYTLTIGPAGIVQGANSTNYIKLDTGGKLIIEGIGVGAKTTEVAFPIGTATSYNPAYITNGAASGVFSASISDKVFKKGVSGVEITNGIVNKTWEITKVSGGANVTLKLGWNVDNEKGTFTVANASIAHLENGWWNFPAAGNTSVDVANRTVTRSGIMSFSPFAVQDAGINPLPVSLTYFKAAKTENGTALNWETASEKNNKGYDVQASADGKHFETVAFVTSKNGNANYSQRYEFLDKTSRSGLVYYRLKQTDFDGTVAYYAAKVVDLGKFEESAVVYPNPFQNQFEVKLNGATTVEVTDLTGKVIFNNQVSAGGVNSMRIDMTNHPAGLYLLKTTTGGTTVINRLIKQ